MMNLIQSAGVYKPDNLIADTSFPVQVAIVPVAANQNTLLKGTVLGKNASNEYVIANTAAAPPIQGSVVLTDDVVTDAAAAVNAQVYVSGPFNRNALIFGGADTSSDHEASLKTNGIYLKVIL
jgi:hypothetical protein